MSAKNRKPPHTIDVHERDASASCRLAEVPVEFQITQRISEKTGLWSATCSWANGAVTCVLRERERGAIEAEGDCCERLYGSRRKRTGKDLRADAITWAINSLRDFYLRVTEQGDEASPAEPAIPGQLTWGEAIRIIRQRGLHTRGEEGQLLSASQQNKNERILDTVSVVWPSDLLVTATSRSHINAYQSARQGDHLEWERDSEGNIKRDEKGKRMLRRRVGRNGRPGQPVTPYAVVFRDSSRKRSLGPVEEVTATGDLRDLQTMLSRLAEERNAKGQPLLEHNPLESLNLGSYEKRKLEAATVERYQWTMRHADDAVRESQQRYPHHVYVPGMLRCVLALVFHTGHRISAVCALRVSDLLLSPARVRDGLGRVRVRKDGERPARSWAEHWPHGAIYWVNENDKEGYDRVIPINAILRAEIERFLLLRRAAGIETDWLFPRPLDPSTHLYDYDARDLLYAAEDLARDAARNAGLDEAALLPVLEDRAFHGYRALWENLRDDLGWHRNKNAAYAGGWTTQTGGSQQVSYNRLKPHFIQAVMDGRSVQEVMEHSVETQRARAAIQTPVPIDEPEGDLAAD